MKHLTWHQKFNLAFLISAPEALSLLWLLQSNSVIPQKNATAAPSFLCGNYSLLASTIVPIDNLFQEEHIFDVPEEVEWVGLKKTNRELRGTMALMWMSKVKFRLYCMNITKICLCSFSCGLYQNLLLLLSEPVIGFTGTLSLLSHEKLRLTVSCHKGGQHYDHTRKITVTITRLLPHLKWSPFQYVVTIVTKNSILVPLGVL